MTLALVSNVFAFDVPAYEDYVTDLAEVFSAEEELNLENKITEIEKATTVEIAVLTIETTGENDIFSYTYEVATKWGVGKKENDNGLMVVIAVDDRKWFMATGYGLEGTLPDAIVKRIGERNYPPNFREGDYAQGVADTLQDVEGYLLADPTVVASYDYSSSDYGDGFQDGSTILVILTVLGFFLIPLKSVWVRKKKKKRKERSAWTTVLVFVIFMVGIHLAVGVIFAIYSLVCDWADASSSGGSSSNWSSGGGWSSGSGWSSGGSSFGGFSGGSFGGGGAGGGW